MPPRIEYAARVIHINPLTKTVNLDGGDVSLAAADPAFDLGAGVGVMLIDSLDSSSRTA